MREDARRTFFPAQVGVAVPAGSEAAVHCARAWHERHAGAVNKVLVKLDFQNAFNTVSRQEVLSATCAQFPALARWVQWCYGGCTTLQFGSTALPSLGGRGSSRVIPLAHCCLQPLCSRWRLNSATGPWTSPCSTLMMEWWLVISLRWALLWPTSSKGQLQVRGGGAWQRDSCRPFHGFTRCLALG